MSYMAAMHEMTMQVAIYSYIFTIDIVIILNSASSVLQIFFYACSLIKKLYRCTHTACVHVDINYILMIAILIMVCEM